MHFHHNLIKIQHCYTNKINTDKVHIVNNIKIGWLTSTQSLAITAYIFEFRPYVQDGGKYRYVWVTSINWLQSVNPTQPNLPQLYMAATQNSQSALWTLFNSPASTIKTFDHDLH